LGHRPRRNQISTHTHKKPHPNTLRILSGNRSKNCDHLDRVKSSEIESQITNHTMQSETE